jgi:poly-beta-1,6-N-acetyl-D-glucosamine synthase
MIATHGTAAKSHANENCSPDDTASPRPMTQRLLLISPVRNESAHFELVARAVAAQTRPPDLWVVVDDRSTDATPEVLATLAPQIDFLRVLSVAQAGAVPSARAVKDRLATAAAPRTFNVGLASVEWQSFTHVAKLDGDTELPPYYFERLLAEFERDPELGLAGGLYADPAPNGKGWRVVQIPKAHHVPGTLKCYSIACFQAIGGLQERLGWDTIDETYARMRGYRTQAFPELIAHHHRPVGSADGTLRGRARLGQCAYIVQFTFPWIMLRAFKIARWRPRVLSGLAFVYGYVRSAVLRIPRVEDPEFRKFVRRELRERIRGELAGRLPRRRRLVPAPGGEG